MSTKATVRQLAREVLGEGASTDAMRSICTWWRVRVTRPDGGVEIEETDRSLRKAYARCAIVLRGRTLPRSSCGTAVHVGNDKWRGCVLSDGHQGSHETEAVA